MIDFKIKYFKYKKKYLDLKQFGGMTKMTNLMYYKYKNLDLSMNDLDLKVFGHKNEKEKSRLNEVNKIIEDFKSTFYLADKKNEEVENRKYGLPILLDEDKLAVKKIDPKESEELRSKIQKVHLLYQAFLTNNIFLFDLINHYWSNFKNPPSVLDIWESLPEKYKEKYDFLYQGAIIGELFYDITLFVRNKLSKSPFYKKGEKKRQFERLIKDYYLSAHWDKLLLKF